MRRGVNGRVSTETRLSGSYLDGWPDPDKRRADAAPGRLGWLRVGRVFGSARADGVRALAVHVGHFFHRLALRAAILLRSNLTRTNRMRAFLGFVGCHRFLPFRRWKARVYQFPSLKPTGIKEKCGSAPLNRVIRSWPIARSLPIPTATDVTFGPPGHAVLTGQSWQ